jgi:hypothetical protein
VPRLGARQPRGFAPLAAPLAQRRPLARPDQRRPRGLDAPAGRPPGFRPPTAPCRPDPRYPS